MHNSVFIKTWINDLPWLRYCLQSIHKFYSGQDEILIIADEDCQPTLSTWGLSERVVYVRKPRNGYIQQQALKLTAHNYTDAEYILFIDSDAIFTRPCSINEFLEGDRVKLICEHYDRLPGIPWKALTEKHVGFSVEYEYMRQLPIVHHRSLLQQIEDEYPGLQYFLHNMKSRRFSEFNFMGAVAHYYSHPKYQFNVYPDIPLPEKRIEQFWSWGGLTPTIENQIKSYLE